MGAVTATAPLPIGFVFSSFEPGGTERQMTELARRLDPTRWEIHVACMRSEGRWADRLPQSAEVTRFGVRSFRKPDILHHISAFANWCRRRDLAIVHTTDL